MNAMTIERRPSYVPQGFALRYALPGGREAGFGWIAEQTVLVYTRGWEREDFTTPLVVVVGRTGAPALVGTDEGFAQPVDVGVPGVEAVYFDGITVPRLDDARDFAGVAWRTGEVHSITARSASGTFAVRAPRTVSRDELVAVLVSLNPGV
jgi:mitochondrial fission protein ELM1